MSGKNTFFLEINAEKRFFFEIFRKMGIKKDIYVFFLYFCKHENAYQYRLYTRSHR